MKSEGETPQITLQGENDTPGKDKRNVIQC